ncbi:MAG: hypothetical protein MHM6MM_000692 [Cercozoa sp. M6MM]
MQDVQQMQRQAFVQGQQRGIATGIREGRSQMQKEVRNLPAVTVDREVSALASVQQMAQQMQERTLTLAPANAVAPCAELRQAAVQCHFMQKDALACRDAVQAFHACARSSARGRAVTTL